LQKTLVLILHYLQEILIQIKQILLMASYLASAVESVCN
jgi:hypothetical protein